MMTSHGKHTIVLVHGPFEDGTVWREVASRLRTAGHTVLAPPIPLRGIATDAAHLATVLDRASDPIVLVAHSYAGAVISVAAQGRHDVKALVYVAAVQPDEGESVGELLRRLPGSKLGPHTTSAVPAPAGPGFRVMPSAYRDVLAADLPESDTAGLAASQRPIAAKAFEETVVGKAAWHSLPTWALIATRDNCIPPDAQRRMAARAGSTAVEVESSHLVPLFHPDAVARTIFEAVRSIG